MVSMYQFATNMYILIKYVPICDEPQIRTYLLYVRIYLIRADSLQTGTNLKRIRTYLLIRTCWLNTYQFMEIRTIFIKNTYVFTASMYVLVLLLMACHTEEVWPR